MPDDKEPEPFYKTTKFLMGVIVALVLILVLVIIGDAVSGGNSACVPTKCEKNGTNSFICCGVSHPLLIDGDSVKLGSKQFTDAEISRLKQINGGNANTTYSIF